MLVPVSSYAQQLATEQSPAALLQNVGTATVYLGDSTGVSPTNYGLKVSPGGSANWPAHSVLWVATAPGDMSELSVLFGAFGVSVTDVKAEVTNPLTISDVVAPVLIQGGGEVLVESGGWTTIAPTGTLDVPIPLGVHGVRYSALNVQVVINTPGCPLDYTLASVDGVNTLSAGTLYRDASLSAFAAEVAIFTVPWTRSDALQLVLFNTSATPVQVSYIVTGVTAGVTTPVSDLAPALLAVPAHYDFPAGTSYVYLPASYTPYALTFTTDAGGACTGLEVSVLTMAGTWQIIDPNAIASGGVTTLGASDRFTYTTRGDGLAIRIRATGAAGLHVIMSRSAPPNFKRDDDTGWISLAPANYAAGVTPLVSGAWNGIRYRRRNGHVYVFGAVTVTSLTPGNLFTLPVGFRPTVQVIGYKDNAVTAGAEAAGLVVIPTSGVVNFPQTSAVASFALLAIFPIN